LFRRRRVQFLVFSTKLEISLDRAPQEERLELQSTFTLSSIASNGINPVAEPIKLQVGTFTTTIPPGSFKKNSQGSFTFAGGIDGLGLRALIKPTGTLRYAFQAKATGPNLAGTKNPVYATLAIGDDSGATSVTAAISH
jgi:hypothetical protein